jgi:hypothetical protein
MLTEDQSISLLKDLSKFFAELIQLLAPLLNVRLLWIYPVGVMEKSIEISIVILEVIEITRVIILCHFNLFILKMAKE